MTVPKEGEKVLLIPHGYRRYIALPGYTPAVGDKAMVYPGEEQHYLVETPTAYTGIKYPIINNIIVGPPSTEPGILGMKLINEITRQLINDNTPSLDVAFTPDGTRMFELVAFQNWLYEYILSTPHDISTAEYDRRTTLQADRNTGLVFSDGGTKAIMCNNYWSRYNIYEYTLSTPYDIRTGTIVNIMPLPDYNPQALRMSDDGKKMFVVLSSTARIYQYNLSSAWNIGTATLVQSIGTQTSNIYGIEFIDGGKTLYEIDPYSARIYERELSTPYDISTAKVVQSAQTEHPKPFGMKFNSDATKLILVGGENTIQEYNIRW